MKFMSRSVAETFKISFDFGQKLKAGSVVCLFGELGAGKTTFMKGLVAGAASYPSEKVSSPTFVYLNIYKGKKTIYHFDLYRLRNADEFIAAGFEEYLYEEEICCIEWSEKIIDLLPVQTIAIHFKNIDQNTREIAIDWPTNMIF